MNRNVVWYAVAVMVPLGVWLISGRALTAILDRLHTSRMTSLPVSPLRYDGGGFDIGGVSLTFGAFDNLRYPLTLDSLPTRVSLAADALTFDLGRRTKPPDPSGRPEIDIIADPGDEVTLTSSQSLLGWPTPFEYRLVGGASPWWKRYTYYRLHWKKPSGASLEMSWRYEQQWYAAGGWTKPLMLWKYQTGLASVTIQPESAHQTEAVQRYLAEKKSWRRGDYRIERRGPSDDGRSVVFAVIHREDEQGRQPGTGKSVGIHLDRKSNQVTKEFGWQ